MHAEAAEFLTKIMPEVIRADRTRRSDPTPTPLRVIEVGAQDVNGSTRDLLGLDAADWSGIDLVDGPGVDYVGDAITVLSALRADGERYDLAIATEVLEHVEHWSALVVLMGSVLNPGGHLVITCAAPGRPPHGASGDPLPAPGEWYENVTVDDIATAAKMAGCRILWRYQRADWPQDSYLVAVKA